MPKSEISDDDAALLDGRLARRPDLPPGFQQVSLDPSACPLAVRAFLVGDGGVGMRSEPDFCGAALDVHGDERHIDDEGERDARMVEVRVVVSRLTRWWCIFSRGQCGVSRHKTQGRLWTERCTGDLRDNWIWAG